MINSNSMEKVDRMREKIYEANEKSEELIFALLSVWEKSVRATHDFLSEAEVRKIKEYVPKALFGVEHLIVVEDERGEAIGFMGIENDRLEMLFLLPSERGKGIGKRLICLAVENYGVRELTVNEQNPQAVGFYEHMGFETYKRTDFDEQGNPYPILYMRRKI